MKRTCLWAITSHDIISCCRWNLERYDNVVNFPNPLASESFPNPLAFESDAESLSCYNVSLISLHTFMGSIQTIKTSVLQELQKYRLTVQLYLPESRRQYWRGQIWDSNICLSRSSSKDYVNLHAVTHWVSLISCWRGTNSSQWRRSLLAIKSRPRYLRQKYWWQRLKLWKKIFKNIEYEICSRLTCLRDVSNFCMNAEGSENMRIEQIPRFPRDLWSTIIANQKSTWRPGPSRRPSILSTIWS